ncbi:MAG: hypothetical protein UU73_C0001G0214 [Candidatus Daviesbacteria bacterium GW2011_GWA1_41_61]|uniref:Uncharacterized protein n=1 Tax=Candidatus Daviesbacteria bacterium GW2011_GWA2_40_9 TaxID=1618424 RepID=A0A0G0X4P8_9BACT|nr:MAG: hypothetical protein UU26_C0017G0010 [Candidatus Daviesbacteria bacterium GW2011_GWC1_40_9]KKR82582.1 MAG: hypothetical protein UU29_C0011G0029 [Candidatus Daviesbacteria bacterium GW2011_GWA2_40_9]KKR93033.1 MAG: hypothetical protein UU44_C0004G0215 [Candidatus Daviesbacteria bacterium GW2011_GWB1_41_15]KKS15577.1 MAG: hypothetical protein UU73_C0001G0214 [Candidatus Daviesbacteria bacterium GW2011_GWA1_41_61]
MAERSIFDNPIAEEAYHKSGSLLWLGSETNPNNLTIKWPIKDFAHVTSTSGDFACSLRQLYEYLRMAEFWPQTSLYFLSHKTNRVSVLSYFQQIADSTNKRVVVCDNSPKGRYQILRTSLLFTLEPGVTLDSRLQQMHQLAHQGVDILSLSTNVRSIVLIGSLADGFLYPSDIDLGIVVRKPLNAFGNRDIHNDVVQVRAGDRCLSKIPYGWEGEVAGHYIETPLLDQLEKLFLDAATNIHGVIIPQKHYFHPTCCGWHNKWLSTFRRGATIYQGRPTSEDKLQGIYYSFAGKISDIKGEIGERSHWLIG